MLNFLPEERPYAIQLFGTDPDVLAEAALIAEQKNPDWIDLNFGCPAKNVVKRGAGAALLKAPEQIAEIIKKVLQLSSCIRNLFLKPLMKCQLCPFLMR